MLVKEWRTKAGYYGRILKHYGLNGYVALPPSHPDWDKYYDDLYGTEENDYKDGINVHGGLTFASYGSFFTKERAKLWPLPLFAWFGFKIRMLFNTGTPDRG